jgi:hypothetical protein
MRPTPFGVKSVSGTTLVIYRLLHVVMPLLMYRCHSLEWTTALHKVERRCCLYAKLWNGWGGETLGHNSVSIGFEFWRSYARTRRVMRQRLGSCLVISARGLLRAAFSHWDQAVYARRAKHQASELASCFSRAVVLLRAFYGWWAAAGEASRVRLNENAVLLALRSAVEGCGQERPPQHPACLASVQSAPRLLRPPECDFLGARVRVLCQ